MIKAIKRLWKDRRGNVLAITGAAIPIVVGSAGLATDTIQWVTWKRELQRAADSAALAGVYGQMQGAATADASVTAALNKNNWGIAWFGTPQITYPTVTGWDSAVRVRVSIQKKLGFSSLFMSATPTITAEATAARVQDGNYCVVALESGATAGIAVGGSAEAILGCGVISNSIAVDESIDVTGNAYRLEAAPVAGSGGLPTESLASHGATDIQPYHAPQQDPFAGDYDTSIPAGTPCTSFSDASKTNSGGTKKPGCYNDFPLPNGTTTLSPGVYYLNNATIDMQGNQSLVGTGVTIIFTGTSPGHIEMNGNGTVNLTAPTDETCGTFNGTNSCNYKKMLFIQSENATYNNNLINGNSGSNFDGAFYFPKAKVTFTGSSEAATQCAMVVSLRVEFTGNSSLQNDIDDDDCDANSQVPSWTVKLVA